MLTGPGDCAVEDVPAPTAAPGEVVVDVERVGVCGTDVELFTGELSYLQTGHSSYPLRPGHEWCGVVTAVGDGVDPAWLGRRVMGDTMLGDRTCRRCRRGTSTCAPAPGGRHPPGPARGAGRAGRRAGRSLHELPDPVDAVLGALVEPGGNAWRAARAARPGPATGRW